MSELLDESKAEDGQSRLTVGLGNDFWRANMNEFECEWKPTERDQKLYELATRYHTETEAYDRTVCTGPMREGSIMPATPHETALIIRNAIAVRKRITFDAERDGFTREELARAISKWNGLYV